MKRVCSPIERTVWFTFSRNIRIMPFNIFVWSICILVSSSMGLFSDSAILENDLQLFNYCSQQSNITIFVDLIKASHLEKFLVLMKELIENEDCYLVNIYLPNEDRSVRFRKNTTINRIHRSFGMRRNTHFDSIPYLTLYKFVKRLYEEPIIGNEFMRQTFVYIVYIPSFQKELLRPLSQLQNERNWEVVIHWLSDYLEDDYEPYSSGSMKIALHRIVCAIYEPFHDLA